MSSPALFLDRDGVVNREIGYLAKPEQVEFLPGIFELCRRAQDSGFKLIIITNQSGIARGLYSEKDFHFLMEWVIRQFAAEQVRIDGYYFCPHHPEHGLGHYRKECPDRKPDAGMLLRAAREHHLDLGCSVLIGDRCSDIQAGAKAGVRRLFLLAGTEHQPCRVYESYTVLQTLAAAFDLPASSRSTAADSHSE